MKDPCVSLLASEVSGVLYVGVTSDLSDRMAEHTDGMIEGFTQKYDVELLVYYEMHATMELAIKRDKNIKGRSGCGKSA